MQDDGGGKNQPADEAAARFVVAAQQEVQRHQDRHRQQQAHQNRRQHQVAGWQLVAQFLAERRRHVGRLHLLRRRQERAFRRRSETPQQGVNGEGDDAQDGDFAESIEAAEIDQNDIHHVLAAAQR